MMAESSQLQLDLSPIDQYRMTEILTLFEQCTEYMPNGFALTIRNELVYIQYPTGRLVNTLRSPSSCSLSSELVGHEEIVRRLLDKAHDTMVSQDQFISVLQYGIPEEQVTLKFKNCGMYGIFADGSDHELLSDIELDSFMRGFAKSEIVLRLNKLIKAHIDGGINSDEQSTD
jgi:hypothetical protein